MHQRLQLQRLVASPYQYQGSVLSLTAQQHHYLCRVLRLGEGDRFLALDGLGHCWLAELAATPLQATLLEPLTLATELPTPVVLLAALPKGNSFDEVVHQVTELGVTTIVPIISDRTLLRPSSHKLERWRRIAQEASEQSERPLVPVLTEPMDFSLGLQTWHSQAHYCYLCVTRLAAPPLWSCLQANSLQAARPLVVAIGPEGGWTEAEINQAIAHDYQPVSLGQRILRTVTAPVVALALIAAIQESFSNKTR